MSEQDLTKLPLSRYLVFLALVASGLTWDLYSKWTTFTQLGCPGAGTWIWPDNWGWQGLSPIIRFQLHTNFNHGALWGLGQGFAPMFAGLSVLAGLGIVYWLFVKRGASSWWLTVALGFVMAGVLGNLYDRLGFHGWVNENRQPIYAVRDFLHFWFFEGTQAEFHWAIFNFADSYLVTGAIMLVIHSFLWQTAEEPKPMATPLPAATKH